jgi:predicted porin
MKKLVLPIGLLALACSAQAQSSVTLFGVADAGLSRGSGSVSARTQLGSGANGTARLGVRGVEDLGGGLSAGFWLEAGLTTDDGQGGASNSNNQASGTGAAAAGRQGLVFARRSTVSLMAPWGEVRVGRDHVAHYRNKVELDPFQNVGAGAAQPHAGTLGGPTATRVSNFIGYYLPPGIGGFFGFGQVYFGENNSNTPTEKDGSGASVRLGYATGPFSVSAATGRTRFAQTATTGDIRSSNVGASYKLAGATLMASYYVDEADTLTGLEAKGAILGVSVPVGAGEIRAAWSNYKSDAGARPQTKKLAVGYVHNLSKRTALYGTYARLRNSGGATAALNGAVTGPNQSSSGWDLGLRHAF